jgi:hypothetical protein
VWQLIKFLISKVGKSVSQIQKVKCYTRAVQGSREQLLHENYVKNGCFHRKGTPLMNLFDWGWCGKSDHFF